MINTGNGCCRGENEYNNSSYYFIIKHYGSTGTARPRPTAKPLVPAARTINHYPDIACSRILPSGPLANLVLTTIFLQEPSRTQHSCHYSVREKIAKKMVRSHRKLLANLGGLPVGLRENATGSRFGAAAPVGGEADGDDCTRDTSQYGVGTTSQRK